MVKANIQRDHYATQISAGNNKLIADEPASAGGTDKGFSPMELLSASLAACTSITMRMYADRKSWNLDGVEVSADLVKDAAKGTTAIERNISLTGNLSDEERSRLIDVANHCPVHKLLTSSIEIRTSVK